MSIQAASRHIAGQMWKRQEVERLLLLFTLWVAEDRGGGGGMYFSLWRSKD